MPDYVYDQTFEQERARLAGMEVQWDPGTFRQIETLGLPADASCWEIGAGGGSVAAWLAARCKHLLVTDIETQFLESLAGPDVRVERHDIVSDPLPKERFDFIHARLVLEHLSQRDAILDRLITALRPGGWLLIEDYDWTGFGIDPASEASSSVTDAVLEVMSAAGFDPTYGRRLFRLFDERGLTDLGAEGRMQIFGSGHPGAAFYTLSLVSLRDAVLASGKVSTSEVDEVLAAVKNGEHIILTPTMIACWGRRQ